MNQEINQVNNKKADTNHPNDIGERSYTWNLASQPKNESQDNRHNN